MPKNRINKELLGVPLPVWFLGFVTFLKNTSSVALVIFCPLYLKEILCINMEMLGLLEGIVESFSFFSRIASGAVSDALKKRQPVLMLGYATSLLGRFLLAISSSSVGFVVSRSFERLGNGIQATPRDALVADYSSPENRGACFGLRHSLTVSGSIVGAFLGMWFMNWTDNDYRGLFKLTLIPSILAIIVLAFAVKDVKKTPKKIPERAKWHLKDFSLLPPAFWKLTAFSTIIMLGNFGIVFLIIAATDHLGLAAQNSPMVMIIQSLATALFAYPLGRLSDKFGKKRMLPLGLICLAIGNFGMVYTPHLIGVFFCVFFWGIQLGIVYNTTLAYVTSVTPEKLRGTGIGFIHLCNGLGTLGANAITGKIWKLYTYKHAFAFNGCLALFALTLIPVLLPKEKDM